MDRKSAKFSYAVGSPKITKTFEAVVGVHKSGKRVGLVGYENPMGQDRVNIPQCANLKNKALKPCESRLFLTFFGPYATFFDKSWENYAEVKVAKFSQYAMYNEGKYQFEAQSRRYSTFFDHHSENLKDPNF